MPTDRTPQAPSLAGQQISYVSVDATGDQFINSGKEFVHVKNGSGVSTTVTVTSPSTNTCNFGKTTGHDETVTIAAGADKMIGPFPIERFNDSTGKVKVTCAPATTITIAVVRP